MEPRCWVSVVYDWGDEGLNLAKTENPEVLALAKRVLLEEAEVRLAVSREVDQIIAILDDAELKRLRVVLDRLIPEEAEKVLP